MRKRPVVKYPNDFADPKIFYLLGKNSRIRIKNKAKYSSNTGYVGPLNSQLQQHRPASQPPKAPVCSSQTVESLSGLVTDDERLEGH